MAVDNLALSIFIQNFFSDPKLAAVCAPFLLFLPTGVAMLGIITPISTGEPNSWVQYLFFMPTFPFEVILTEIFQPDATLEFFEVSAAAAWVFLVLQTPIYFFLHVYIEAVLPDAYGVTESCCFCFRRGGKKQDVESDEYHDFEDEHNNSTINDDENGLLKSNPLGRIEEEEFQPEAQ